MPIWLTNIFQLNVFVHKQHYPSEYLAENYFMPIYQLVVLLRLFDLPTVILISIRQVIKKKPPKSQSVKTICKIFARHIEQLFQFTQ